MPQELYLPPASTREESRGLYEARAHGQEAAMRNQGDRNLIPSLFEDSHELASAIQ